MTKTEFYRELEIVMDAPEGSIKGDESLKDFPGWTSLSVLSFLAMADSDLGEKVEPSRVAQCKTIEDLRRLFPGKIED